MTFDEAMAALAAGKHVKRYGVVLIALPGAEIARVPVAKADSTSEQLKIVKFEPTDEDRAAEWDLAVPEA